MGKNDRLYERAAGIVIAREAATGTLWLLLRNARLGHWGFAKGKLEEGEGELAGALREVREETGLSPEISPAFREMISYEIPGKKKEPPILKEVVYYLGTVAPGAEARKSGEHDRLEWLVLENALAKLEHEQLKGVLRRAARFLAEESRPTPA